MFSKLLPYFPHWTRALALFFTGILLGLLAMATTSCSDKNTTDQLIASLDPPPDEFIPDGLDEDELPASEEGSNTDEELEDIADDLFEDHEDGEVAEDSDDGDETETPSDSAENQIPPEQACNKKKKGKKWDRSRVAQPKIGDIFIADMVLTSRWTQSNSKHWIEVQNLTHQKLNLQGVQVEVSNSRGQAKIWKLDGMSILPEKGHLYVDLDEYRSRGFRLVPRGSISLLDQDGRLLDRIRWSRQDNGFEGRSLALHPGRYKISPQNSGLGVWCSSKKSQCQLKTVK